MLTSTDHEELYLELARLMNDAPTVGEFLEDLSKNLAKKNSVTERLIDDVRRKYFRSPD